jgi:hypothetical protein
MKKVKNCFNCGKPISRKDGNETVEHIPMQSLFDGYSDDHKVNRITVPCCKECNNATSALDEEFRNWIGSISNLPEMQPIADKTIKSILHYKKQFDRIYVDSGAGTVGLLSKPKQTAEYLKKVFKGIFYHQYKYHLPSEYTVAVDFDKNKSGELSTPNINYLLKNFEYKYSGSPVIFKYILQPAAPEKYIALIVFNETFTVMAYASVINRTKIFA